MIIIKAQKNEFNEIENLIKNEFPYTKKNMKEISVRVKEGNIVLVAKEKNNLFGFIEFKLNGFNATLLGFAVKKEFREKGLGKKPLNFFVDLCKKNKIENISLIVKTNNFQAKKLYESKGFVKTKELKKKIGGFVIEEMKLDLNVFQGIN